MKNNKHKQLGASTLLATTLLTGTMLSGNAFAIAETVHPRDYIPAPVGVNLSVTYLDQRSGDDAYASGDQVANNMNMDVVAGVQRFIHFTELFGVVADPQIIIPYVNLEVGAANEKDTGIGDIFFGSTFWTINDPENREWFGITPFIYAPTGAYDSKQAVNVGANRWSAVLQAGYVKGLTDNLYMDLVGEVQWYGDNDDPFGGNTLEKEEAYRFSTMFSYDLNPASYVWARHAMQFGGEEKLDGIKRGTELDNHTLSLGYTRWIGKEFQVQVEYTKDLEIDNGIEVEGFTLRGVIPF